jgi:hypothetical protein
LLNRNAVAPKSVEKILGCLTPCFTQPGFGNFATLIIGWIMCPGRHSISRVIQASDAVGVSGKHHSSLYRFLKSGRWTTDALARLLLQLLVRFLPEEITLIIDDTLCHKSGPHLFGGAMHYDSQGSTYGRGTSQGRKGAFAFGHNWVVAAVSVPCPWNPSRQIAVPFLFRLYRVKKQCSSKEHRKRTELAAEMIRLVASWLPDGRKLHVVADAEYACKTVVRALPDGVAFTGPMGMDAALYESPEQRQGRGRPAKKGARLPSPKHLARSRSTPWQTLNVLIYGRTVAVEVKSMVCLWYTVAGVRLVRMVLTRDPSRRLSDRAYFTTEVECEVEDILVQFARRWEIEVSFRNTKQNLGIEDPQNGWWRRLDGTPRPKKKPGPNPRGRVGEQAINHTLAVAFASHAIVVLWYWQHGRPEKDAAAVRADAPWYRQKAGPSFTDMLVAVRHEIWAARFSRNPLAGWGREKTRRLLPRWLLAA